MRKYMTFLLAMAALVFSASTCEKMEPGDYHDYLGNKINLLGGWVLTEVRYKTAGVIESHPCEPQSVMEFAEKGIGYTKDLAGDMLDENTISSEEQISSNSSIVNIYSRYDGNLLTRAVPEEMYSPNTLIIMYDAEVGKEALRKAVEEYRAGIIYDYSIIPGMAVRIPEESDIRKAIAFFKEVEGVVSVERDRIYRLTDPVRPRLEVQ